jgi:hypothetical protein
MDHYKPKYPLDLLEVFRRGLPSDEGVLLLHDVLTHAAPQWRVCLKLCDAFGYTSQVDASVFQGAGIIRRRPAAVRTLDAARLQVQVAAAWHAHATALRARRAAGRLLRALHLR